MNQKEKARNLPVPRQEILLRLVVEQDDGKLRRRLAVAFIILVLVFVLVFALNFVLVLVLVMVVPL